LEMFQKLNDVLKYDEMFDKTILISPTNSGKTTFFIKNAIQNKIKTILIVSLQSAIQQAKFDHPEIGVYYQFEKTKNLHACDCIATTYQSFNKVCAILKDELQDWHVVYDEAHNAVLSADKNYRGKEMNRIL